MEKKRKTKKKKTKKEGKGLRELHLLGGAGVSSRVVGINGQKGVYGHGATAVPLSFTLSSLQHENANRHSSSQVHVLPPPTYLGNTNNLQIHLYPLHNRYGWTVSDVDKKFQ